LPTGKYAVKQKPLNQLLFDEPYRFEFFQAVRLLEKIFPERKAVGLDAMPHEEIVRFRSHVSFNFPASEIQQLEESIDEHNDEKKLEMYINFMGMVGMSGVMPLPYTELIAARARYKDTAMWAFMDMFSHRMISMFFRAWEKYRFPIGYERGQDKFTGYLFDIAGLGTSGLRGRMSLADESLLPYSGLIAQKPHSSNALANILIDYFEVNAKVIQFFGQWLDLDRNSITKLGAENSLLSRSAIIGTRIWDQQSKFRIVLGAMTFKQFQAFLPNGSAHKALISIVRFMNGLEYDFDFQLKLKAKEVPSCILTTRAKRRPMLGWSSWLKTHPFEEDDDQVILQT
jgi:type VI secretion system protein ImpH